jgi:hypothetical protein
MNGPGYGPNAPPAFTEYSDLLRGQLQHTSITTPSLVDWHPPNDDDDGAFVGTVGVFQQLPAIASPLGPWYPDYQGIMPISAQVQLSAPEPWESVEDFNG